jgi:hypothetical protein
VSFIVALEDGEVHTDVKMAVNGLRALLPGMSRMLVMSNSSMIELLYLSSIQHFHEML